LIPRWRPLNKNLPDQAALIPIEAQLPPAARASFWAANRRRPAFLAVLVTGLTGFLIWLPSGARASLWNGLSAQRGLVILLFLFAMLTLSLVWTAGQRLDVRIFTLFNTQHYPQWLDRLMWLTTQLGNLLAAFLAATLLFILDYRRMAFEVVFGTLTLWLLVETIKALADRERPFHTLEKTRVIGWKEIGHSFPSGHTTQIFFLATLFIHRFQLGLGIAISLYAIAAVVGFTRIYVGAHYPRDVVAGVVLGSVWGILAMVINPYLLSFHL
jgi:membrane-associated phospholipid phosphatase